MFCYCYVVGACFRSLFKASTTIALLPKRAERRQTSLGKERLMKGKLLTILCIGLLVFSCLNVALAATVKCPDCDGTGEIECPSCNGTGETSEGTTECTHCEGTGILTPRVTQQGMVGEQHDGATYIHASYKNYENFDVDGTVTADLKGHTNSTTFTFPASQTTEVVVVIDYLGSYQTVFQFYQDLHVSIGGINEITCPYCDGEGVVAAETGVCPECGGAGTIECPTCGGTGYVDEALIAQSAGIPLATVEAVVVVLVVAGVGIGAFMMLRKRRVSEKSLRRRSAKEFNDWVLSRLEGKPAASRDTAMGIDGYTFGGYPVLIKQSDNIGMPIVDTFAASLARNRARNGVIVAFSFGSDAVRGKVRAKLNYKLDIEMLTVQDLIYNKRRL
jgi:hypothetical protein